MSAITDAILAMDDGLNINNLIKYIVAEELSQPLSDNIETGLEDDNMKTNARYERISCSVPDTAVEQFSTKHIRKQKVIRSKAFYNFREKELEKRSLDAINKLKQALEEHNNIQKERNEIFRTFAEMCKVTYLDEYVE